MTNHQDRRFPDHKELKRHGARAKRTDTRWAEVKKSLPDGDIAEKVFSAMSAAAVRKGGKNIGEFSILVETGEIDSCALCKESVAREFMDKSSGNFSYQDFLGFSERERGKQWDEVAEVLGQVVASGYEVTNFHVEMKDHPMLDRCWVYPVTITFRPA